MSYESEVKLIEGGEAVVVTKGNDWEPGNEYLEKTERRYPSVTTLRKSLVRENLRAELFMLSGGMISSFGGVLSLSALLNVYTYNRVAELGVGVILFAAGYRLLKHEQINESKIDSRIRAFNTTFPNLKPIPFSSMLAAIKAPFCHR